MTYIDRAREVIDMEAEGLKAVCSSLDESFDKAVEILLECLSQQKKIIVTGIGKNLHIAEKVSATLASTGSTSVSLNPSQAMHGDLGIITKGDVVIFISYSGESDELTDIIPMVKRCGAKIVALTGYSDSALAQSSDIVIVAKVEREACPFNMAPTTSTTAALAVGDAIAMTLLDARGFDKEDYAKLHPGGAIGKALLLKVSDIMRTVEHMAIVNSDAKVKEALIAMTKARAGSACVTDKDKKVIGIFTDGDLRRHISENENILEANVQDVMSPSPVTVSPDQLAADALAIFEQNKIDDLLVVDNDKPVGSVDIQDLPALKVM